MKKILVAFVLALVATTTWAGGPQTQIGFSDLTGTVGIANGGTGQTTAAAARTALGTVASSEVTLINTTSGFYTKPAFQISWIGTTTYNIGTFTMDAEGAAIVSVTAAGVVSGAGGGAGASTFIVTNVNGAGCVATQVAQIVAGTLTGLDVIPAPTANSFYIRATGHASLQNTFATTVDIKFTAADGSGNKTTGVWTP